jgi:hypothetical protein
MSTWMKTLQARLEEAEQLLAIEVAERIDAAPCRVELARCLLQMVLVPTPGSESALAAARSRYNTVLQTQSEKKAP